MSRSSHSNPKLYIAGSLIPTCSGADITYSGKNQITKFSATIMDPDLKETSLFGKEVVYYLNYGSSDGTPIFRGYITSVSGSETNVKITAVDVRGYLTLDFRKIEITDKNNYDGFTLGQFLKHYIDKFINTDRIYIGTDKINDTEPAVTLSKVRGTFKVYDLISSTLKKAVDTGDDNEPLDYSISVVHDTELSYIVFKKKKRLNEVPALTFSRTDGIIRLTYNERPRKFVATLKDRDFVYGSNPTGPFNISVSQVTDEKLSPEDLREIARKKILKEFNNNVEITITASKGHYVDVGNMVQLNVHESLLLGPQRITSKKISVKKQQVTLNITLNKEPIKLSEYLIVNI